MAHPYSRALIVGAGQGLSASLARLFAGNGLAVALAARDTAKLEKLCAETGAEAHACDATKGDDVARLFQALDGKGGAPDVVVYNASARVRGPLVSLEARDVERSIMVSAFGGFLVAREAVRRMVPQGKGAILFTGASASVKGYPEFGILCHGQVRPARTGPEHGARIGAAGHPCRAFRDRWRHPQRHEAGSAGQAGFALDPDAIAQSYLQVLGQKRSAWTWEMELRPWVERF